MKVSIIMILDIDEMLMLIDDNDSDDYNNDDGYEVDDCYNVFPYNFNF